MNINREKKSRATDNAMLMRYRQADELGRLFMFLQYRHMRDDFMEIEFRDRLFMAKLRTSA